MEIQIEEIIKILNFSNLGWQVTAPIIFSICDIITGFIQAVINENVKSKIMRQGLLHKILIIIILLLSFVASAAFNMSLISKFVCVYIVIMETISIFENLAKAGLNFKNLLEIFFIGRKENKKNGEIKEDIGKNDKE